MRLTFLIGFSLFLLGWLAGSFFVFTFITNSFNSGEIKKSFDISTNLRGKIFKNTNKYGGFVEQSITPIPTLPFRQGYDNIDNEEYLIIMDFPVDDRLFTIENYFALESLLTLYPNATFKILLAAPLFAYTEKTGNLLSVNQFIKYRKRSYDIDVVPVGRQIILRKYLGSIGKLYWKKWEKCCDSHNIEDRNINEDQIQPYHVLTFIRLTNLWNKGGIFTDFSFFFIGILDHTFIDQGFYINTFCSSINISSLEVWQQNELQSGNNSSNINMCYTSTLLIFNKRRSDILLCVLKKYDNIDFIQCIENDHEKGGAACIYASFIECFAKAGTKNELEIDHNNNNKYLETFGNDAYKAKETILGIDWKLSSTKKVFWLGTLGFSGKWTNYPYQKGSLLNKASKTISLTKIVNENNPICKIKHSHYYADVSDIDEHIIGTGTGIEQVSSSPTIIVPGFLKSATTFLFNAITSHPQVLPPIKGHRQIDKSCYSPTNIESKQNTRSWCFPFINEDEPLTSADCSVYYATDPYVPLLIHKDNINMKIVFPIRHPVDRMYSSYKEAYSNYKLPFTIIGNNRIKKTLSFDEIIEIGMEKHNKYGILRQMMSKKHHYDDLNDKDIINSYYNNSFQGDEILSELFQHSIPYPVIAHYINILGKDNVYVVNVDDLDAHNMPKLKTEISKIFNFLKLCPYDIPDINPLPPARNRLAPNLKMSLNAYKRLNNFFIPFNNVLANLTGLNLTSWNYRWPSYILPINPSGTNTTLPPAWFELLNEPEHHINSINSNGLMAHLLPDNKENSEDNGFNTTFGILTMF